MKSSRFSHLVSTLIAILFFTSVDAQITVFTEDFEGASLNVTSSSASGNNNNAWAINSSLASNGTKSDSARVTLGDTVYLETNAFSTMGYTNVSMSFDQICKIDFFDRAFIEYSTNNGASWTRLTSNEYNGTGFFGTSYFSAVSYTDWNPGNASATPANSWWKSESFDLTATAGNMQVKVRWMLVDQDNNGPVNNYGWLIDNIDITAAPCELIPPSITITSTIYQGQVYFTGPYAVSADIVDASGVASATLSYTVNSGPVQNISMSNTSGNIWVGLIPAATVGDTVCYSISAVDNTTCSNSASLPSNGCTQFIVANNPPPSCVGTPVFNFNYMESFASFTPGNGSGNAGILRNDWVNDNTNDSHDWWVFDQATPSGGTGPTQDNSLGDANYMYVEASGNFRNTTAILNTPCYDFTNLNSPKFDFYYHMLGNNMGELHVDIFFGGQWVLDVTPAIIGNQGPNWNYRRVDLSAYAGSIVKLRFRAIVGTNFASDIAIDDIEIIEPLTSDVGITNIFSPSATGCVGTAAEFVTLEVASFGSTPVDTIPMAYTVNGGAVIRDTLFQRVNELDTINFSFQQTVNMSTVGTYSFQFWVELPNDQNTTNDSILTYTLSTSNVIGVFPDTNDFDNFTVGIPGTLLDGWSNSPNGDTHDWYVNTGATPSNFTGPTMDNTGRNGNYMFVEASNFNNRVANLLSKCLDINSLNQPELNFYYHMSGIEMGELHVDININGIDIQDITPAIIGDQGANWNLRTIDLTPYKGNIRLTFRAITGPGYRSDIAVDDVTLRDANPVGIDPIERSEDALLIYPNPAINSVSISHTSSEVQTTQIYNSVGKLVWEAQLAPKSNQLIDVSNWSKGVYQIRMSDSEGQSTQKLIVQ